MRKPSIDKREDPWMPNWFSKKKEEKQYQIMAYKIPPRMSGTPSHKRGESGHLANLGKHGMKS